MKNFSNRTLGTTIVERGYILPSRSWRDVKVEGGIVDSSKKFVPASACYENGSCGYVFEEENVKEGSECIYLGFFLWCYGHAITDAFRKTWYLDTDEGLSLIRNGAEVVYVSAPNTAMPLWQQRLLDLGGVRSVSLKHVADITRYKRIVIPDNCIFTENGNMFYTQEFKAVINRIKRSIKIPNNFPVYPMIYYTRTGLSLGGREWGEVAIERQFRKKGYAIISPEKYTVDEQIWFMKNCQKFASTECSSSHSAIFCNETAEVAVLKKANYVNMYSDMISDLVGFKNVYIKAHHSIKIHRKGHMWGPFYLYPTSQLRDYLGFERA